MHSISGKVRRAERKPAHKFADCGKCHSFLWNVKFGLKFHKNNLVIVTFAFSTIAGKSALEHS
jgi:hypothetical protein